MIYVKYFVNCNLLKIKIERWESKYWPVECFIWGQAVFSFLQQHPQPKPSQDCPATKACLSWLDIFIIIIIYIFRQSTFLLVGLYLSLSFCVIMRRENFRVHKLQLTYWSIGSPQGHSLVHRLCFFVFTLLLLILKECLLWLRWIWCQITWKYNKY